MRVTNLLTETYDNAMHSLWNMRHAVSDLLSSSDKLQEVLHVFILPLQILSLGPHDLKQPLLGPKYPL